MTSDLLTRITDHQARTFGLTPATQVRDLEAAVAFVEQRGFAFFWPIRDLVLPSLWTAVAGDRPVPDEHDDPGHVTWGWKDSLLGKRRWYYAKVLRKRATMISLAVLPAFYALSPNYGDPEEDMEVLYQQGLVPQETRQVFQALVDEGPLDTLALRRAARLTRQGEAAFNRALTDLQTTFKILPVGVAPVGAWRYAFIYELTHRHFPDLIEQTRFVSDEAARQTLLRHYFAALGAAQFKDALKLFGWGKAETEAALAKLVAQGFLVGGLELPSRPGEWFALAELSAP